MYLPVELFHLLFQSREVGFFAPCALDDLPELRHVLFQQDALLAEFLQRRFDRAQRMQGVERRRARVSGQITVVVLVEVFSLSPHVKAVANGLEILLHALFALDDDLEPVDGADPFLTRSRIDGFCDMVQLFADELRIVALRPVQRDTVAIRSVLVEFRTAPESFEVFFDASDPFVEFPDFSERIFQLAAARRLAAHERLTLALQPRDLLFEAGLFQ